MDNCREGRTRQEAFIWEGVYKVIYGCNSRIFIRPTYQHLPLVIRKKDQHKSLAAPENEAKTALERTLVKKDLKTPFFTWHVFLYLDATQASQRKTEVVCPIPKYFRAFLHDSRRFRRTRTVFTRAQLHELEERFEREKYLSTHGRKDFARQLKLTPLQVKTWFQNRRMKWKKEMLRKDPNAVTTRAKGRPKKDEFWLYRC